VFLSCLILEPLQADIPLLNWNISGFKLSEAEMKRLKSEFPYLKSSSEIDRLLVRVSNYIRFDELEGEISGNTLTLRGRRSATIRRITNNLDIMSINSLIELATQSYIDRVNNEQVVSTLIIKVQKVLRKKGFYNSVITVQSIERNKYQKDVHLDIDLGQPCFIKGYKTKFVLPTKVRFGIDTDLLCDQDIAQSLADELKSSLSYSGYRQSNILTPLIKLNRLRSSAFLIFDGKLGQEIKYNILMDQSYYELQDVIDEETLKRIDPDFVSADTIRSELERYFGNQGFADINVTIKRSTDSSLITFEVKDGPQYRIHKVTFEGNGSTSSEELRKIIELTDLEVNRPLFNQDLIEDSVDNIRNFYQKLGFWDVKVREPRVTKDADRELVGIEYSIEEGRKRTRGTLEILGGVSLDQDQLKELLKLKPGQAFDRSQLVDFETKIKREYLNRGYLFASIKTTLFGRPEDDSITVDLKTEIIEGRRVEIGFITITGLIETQRIVVLRELLFKSGDWYNPRNIDTSRKALIDLGLFRSVQIRPSSQQMILEQAAVLDLTIELREGRSGQISFGPGWSLWRGQRYGIEGSYKNISGIGRQIFAKAKISEEAQQQAIGSKTLVGRTLSFGYLEPYVLGLPVDGSVSLSSKAQAFVYWTLSHSGEIALRHKFKTSYLLGSEITAYYRQRFAEIYDRESYQNIDLDSGRTRIGQVGLRLRLDKRNHPSWPTSGFYLRFENALARTSLGGELNYIFWDIENNYFLKLAKHTVFAFGVNLAVYQDISRKNDSDNHLLPASERLGLEGARVVRGFQENSLGPRLRFLPGEDGETVPDRPTLGSHLALFHLELRRQIIPETMGITYFVDSGSVFFEEKELEGFNQSESFLIDNEPYTLGSLVRNPHYLWHKNYVSHGIALSYLTPIGSVNLAYGLPLKRCASSATSCSEPRGRYGNTYLTSGETHLSIGATF
jgi:outer membrane protein assembly complex protein YaeT